MVAKKKGRRPSTPEGRAVYNKYMRERNREHRRRCQELKNKPCQDCGNSYPPYCMDWDHRNPNEKEYSVGSMTSGTASWERILAEIAKCDLVCANCHRIRTYKEHM